MYRGASLIRNRHPLGHYSASGPVGVLGGGALSYVRGTPVITPRHTQSEFKVEALSLLKAFNGTHETIIALALGNGSNC